MCGRYTLTSDVDDLAEAFAGIAWPETLPPRYNIAPTQGVLAVPNTSDRAVALLRWGLIPPWAKDPAIGNRMINARAETLAEKPSFRSALKRRRCLIPADGFYEWQKPAARGGAKTPMHVRLTSGAPFAFAGLWEVWHAPDGSEIASCTIITTTPNELMAPIHNRMPVILAPDAYDPWLDPAERSSKELAALLTPYPAAEMTANPVGATVNNPRNDSPDCILAVKNA